jgi:hypothetical protein
MKKLFPIVVLILLALPFVAGACSNNTATTSTTATKPVSGAVVNSDSIVTAQIQSIQKQSSGNSWQLNVVINSSLDVGSLPNPTKSSIGNTVTVFTDQDMSGFKVGDNITGHVKYGGDVNIPGGIRLVLSDASKITIY